MKVLRQYGAEKATPLLALDIDGTVREGKDDALGKFVNAPEDVRVFPGAVKQMRRWKEAGGRIIGVSNQGGVALGLVEYDAVVAAMKETYRQAEFLFDRLVYCTHHPDAEELEMSRCWCRKPAPGLLIEGAISLAAQHTEYYPPYMGLFVGDREEDRECARLCGFDFQEASEWRQG